ncbi:MAG: right-handed parallel beta-helix repeat-containing protein [Verrucomicrobia bacterium]|nr:right-handed parallel beta-helix repeat-containing protein [Verrucomicrobiota bacterium]
MHFRSACLLALGSLLPALAARELHVSPAGNDSAPGSAAEPLRTISAAANRAQAGDTITVHAGTYRERVTPPRGGTSDSQRITYQAAPGETVILKGSEVVRDWKPFLGSVWKAVVPNALFGKYHPYKDLINGDWFTDKGRPHHTGEVYLNGKSLYESHLLERVLNPQPHPESRDPEGSRWTWFCEVDAQHTYLYANFHGRDPNRELVEINVRDACFYPAKPGCDYITVRGFRMAHAATQWAAPTAEQIGLLGTHWSKGWIIEHNIISDSKCSGITLGKDRATGHNVWNADRTKDGALHYNEVIDRALAIGWSRARIGGHVVRHNVISHCEQTGICGSLGAVFSTLTDNHLHSIWTKRQFAGAEIAGIKLHAAIDVVISRNRIHNAGRGLWMDWMAQGTRIERNLCYDNTTDDLFVEVNHGPFVVDHNFFLSPTSLRDWSQGGAYAHNLFTGVIDAAQELRRVTPYHPAHDTSVVDRVNIPGGDNRWYNNVFVGTAPERAAPKKDTAGTRTQRHIGFGTWVYDTREHPSPAAGNVYLRSARPSARETGAVTRPDFDPQVRLVEEGDRVFLEIQFPPELAQASTQPVTTALLGRARVPNVPFENRDGTALVLSTDYLGKARPAIRPTSGPIEAPGSGVQRIKLW